MTQKSETAVVEINFAIRSSTEKYDTIDQLIKSSDVNVDFYKSDKSFVGVKIHASFEKVIEMLRKSVPVVKNVESFASKYDFDEKTPGNGYRSFVFIFEAAVKHTEKICKYITENRSYLLFRKSVYMKWGSSFCSLTSRHWIYMS